MTIHPRLRPLPDTDWRTPAERAVDALRALPEPVALDVIAAYIEAAPLPVTDLRALASRIDREADRREG